MKCQIKSKYLGVWQQREINLDSIDQCFLISKASQTKRFYFNQIRKCQIIYSSDEKKELLILENSSRSYLIDAKREKLQKIVDLVGLWNHFKSFKQMDEEDLPKPKVINYKQMLKVSQKAEVLDQNKKLEKEDEQYTPQYENFYKTEDWKRDEKEGGMNFINQTKKSLQPKIIKFLISKFLSTGSFMGISFPVFAMKPQSNLQTYCRCISLAPKLLNGVKNPIQRLKFFNCLILTMSIRYTDIDKSFNPVIGETFQSKIGNDNVYAEQISHHPPVTAFLLQSKDFRLYASLEVRANMGLNSAKGLFHGDVICQFRDGGKLIGKMPGGILSGFIFGRYCFNPEGANYSYDPINQLVCSYQVVQKDQLSGHIGKMKLKNYQQFLCLMQSQDEKKWKKKFEEFNHLQEKLFDKIYSKMQVIWSSQVSYDKKIYIKYQEEHWKPPKLNKKAKIEHLLKSDSRFRKDIALRFLQKIQESQEQKETIQNQERQLRKLRQANINPKS